MNRTNRTRSTALLLAATLLLAVPFSASAERLRFEGTFNVAIFGCDQRIFECLPDQWLTIAEPITPIPFVFTIDVTQVAEQVVVRSSTWVAPNLVPESLISGSLPSFNFYGFPPFDKATFDSLVNHQYITSRSATVLSDGSWLGGKSNRWEGLVPPVPTNPADPFNELRIFETVTVNLQPPGTAPATFADLMELFDHYLTSKSSVDLIAEFGFHAGDPRDSFNNAPFSRMAGDFRLASIQCRAPSAASTVLAGLGAALRGSN
jgi:hypothetical protein